MICFRPLPEPETQEKPRHAHPQAIRASAFINERLKESGIPPSFDEMKDALDLRSKSAFTASFTALEERGFIRRLTNRARRQRGDQAA